MGTSRVLCCVFSVFGMQHYHICHSGEDVILSRCLFGNPLLDKRAIIHKKRHNGIAIWFFNISLHSIHVSRLDNAYFQHKQNGPYLSCTDRTRRKVLELSDSSDFTSANTHCFWQNRVIRMESIPLCVSSDVEDAVQNFALLLEILIHSYLSETEIVHYRQPTVFAPKCRV